MVLQVKYEGPAESFGWLVPVPSLPEVRKGSMDCFYELSRLTQLHMNDGAMIMSLSMGSHGAEAPAVDVIKIKTVGAYEVAVLATTNSGSLSEWLNTHGFAFPADKQSILDEYISKHWYFVAAKIDPSKSGFTLQHVLHPDNPEIAKSTREKLANGELNPLVISFPSEKCVFPLSISAANGKKSEVSLYVLSHEPLISPKIFGRKIAKARQLEERATSRAVPQFNSERLNAYRKAHPAPSDDPNDPQPELIVQRPIDIVRERYHDPFMYRSLLESMDASPSELKACAKLLPRLKEKAWNLTKETEMFDPEEMADLEFEPAVPWLLHQLQFTNASAAAVCLAETGKHALPAICDYYEGANERSRRFAVAALARVTRPDAITGTTPASPLTSWVSARASELAGMLDDPEPTVRNSAGVLLSRYPDSNSALAATYKKIVISQAEGAQTAFGLIPTNQISKDDWRDFLNTTNASMILEVMRRLKSTRPTVDAYYPLTTNSVQFARLLCLREISEANNSAAMDMLVSMLHDPDETVRWRVRQTFRKLTGQKLGADPAVYEKWWADFKDAWKPIPRRDPRDRNS